MTEPVDWRKLNVTNITIWNETVEFKAKEFNETLSNVTEFVLMRKTYDALYDLKKESAAIIFSCLDVRANLNAPNDKTLLCHLCPNATSAMHLNPAERHTWYAYQRFTEAENSTFQKIYEKISKVFLDIPFVFTFSGY